MKEFSTDHEALDYARERMLSLIQYHGEYRNGYDPDPRHVRRVAAEARDWTLIVWALRNGAGQ